ncbi:MAG: STAS domain-containing protein [Candidatus Sericytochromatia bacterium]|nr:STAS domain-containing protein [Candidatus Sericytochromatia bacterium]
MFIAITATEDPETVCMYMEGSLNAASQQAFESKFQEATQRAQMILIDFSAIEQIDSVGLGALIRCFHNGLAAQVRLVLMHLQFQPRSVIELTKIEQVFEVLSPKYLSGRL